ncbi:sulfatase-like hydrolase/transferase [Verrucomicrobiaceae bacterium N1E253]|uniref:Sulfatase-like hydrolase/transferase n=2 Tax=Oceaniferula marina TaxID=2748318 RepID=A0A851GDG5_9BACT|nr:sulfatase-like hydrolase/transferase [Oceaniferula marina]
MCDDLGFGDIYNLHQHKRDNGAGGGIAGDGVMNGTEEAFIYTPQLDRMIAEGAKLTRHYTSAPVCAPARGSLLQGRDQGHANIRDNSFDKRIDDNHTLGTVMQSGGYYTACVGKWGVGGTSPTDEARPNNRGFDYFYGYTRHIHGHQHYPGNGGTVVEQSSPVTSGLDHAYTTDLWTAKVKSIIQDRTTNHAGTPFFIYLAYDAPHAQLQVPTQAYPAGSGTSGGLSWPLNTNSGTNDSWIHPDYSALSNAAARHATMVRRIDTCMGDILQTLRDLNIDDNTLVIFTSDNGTHNESGSGGSVAHNPRNFDSYGELEGIKRDHWEGGIRVPTFAWWPGSIGDNNPSTPGRNSLRPSAFWDWMPTVVDAAGLTPPAWTTGVSLLPELTGTGDQKDKGYLYFEYNVGGSTPNYTDFPNHGGATRGQMQTIFMDDTDGKRYKGVRTNVSSHSQDFQIYDVDADSDEGTNLAAGKPTLQQKMKDRVLQVRLDGDYNRSYLSGEYAPGVVTPVVQGMNYKVFTGIWPWVPETAGLTPVASGDCSGLDLTVRTQDDNVVIEFTGYLQVPTDGEYTFRMTTDTTVADNGSGGMLWVHDAHVIDDDFNHDGTERNGSMRLKAGIHPIRVLYKHRSGSHDISLRYSGPGVSLQDVPLNALYRAGTPAPEPTAVPDHASADGVSPVAISVLQNDYDDGQPSTLQIQSVSSPPIGSAAINGDQIIYTPEAGKYGQVTFRYTITDGQYLAESTVTVDVCVPSADLWFPLNETTGNTVSEAGGKVVGTHSGVADSEAVHIEGKHGYALSLDGVDDQVNLSGVVLPTGDSPRTVAAWIRVSATSGVENQVIFGYGVNTNGKRFSFRLDGTTTQKLRLEVQGGYIVGSTNINDGQWHHVAVVVDDFNGNSSTDVNECKLYVDGVQEVVSGSSSEVMNTDPGGVAVIGASNHATSYNFKGDIDELRVFAGAKSSAEMADLAAADEQVSSLWLYRHFGSVVPSWSDDRDGDGVDLLQEYGFGGNPHQADAPTSEPTAVYNEISGRLEVQYNRRKPGSHDLQYSIEVSDDLVSWLLPFQEVSAVSHPLLGFEFQQVLVETLDAVPEMGRRFVRVKVE